MIHRAGTEIVNWYLLEEGGRVTIVDAGCPGYRPQLDEALRAIGRDIGDVEALVLTHAHIDHIGFAQKLQAERGIPVHAHTAEVPQATTGKAPKTDGSFLPALVRYGPARKAALHILRNGGGRPPRPGRGGEFPPGAEPPAPARPPPPP